MAVVVAQVPVKLVCEVEPAFGFGAAPGIEQLLRCELPRTHHGPELPAQRTKAELTPSPSVVPSTQANCIGVIALQAQIPHAQAKGGIPHTTTRKRWRAVDLALSFRWQGRSEGSNEPTSVQPHWGWEAFANRRTKSVNREFCGKWVWDRPVCHQDR
jgi:hypothetical protein